MTRPLALLRPEPGWSVSAAAVRAAGLEVIGHPLFDAEPVAWEVPPGDFDAVLAGSGAAFRIGGSSLAALTSLPVFAVGEATADAARATGFLVAETGEGGLQHLLDATASQARRFLRLAGKDHVALYSHVRQSLTEVVVYRMVSHPLDPKFALKLAEARPLVALHSAAAAEHFAREIDRFGLRRGDLFLLALGPRVAKAAGLGWAAVHIADRPSDAALLAKAVALCK